MKDKTPRKKKVKSKRAEKFDPKDSKEIQDLTQKALTAFLQNQLTHKNDTKKNLDALSSTIEEFLNSYILLGYSLDGTPVHIISAHNQQEADSLTALVNKFITNSNNNED